MKLTREAESGYSKQRYPQTSGIDGVRVIDLRRFNDAGGSLTELGRFEQGRLAGLEAFTVAQVNYSTVEPALIKAFHLHRRQTDVWYVPPEDRILLVLVDVRAESATEGQRQRLVLGDTHPRLVRIPPGVAHGCRNLARETGRIIYFSDLQFSPEPEECDEGRLPWDFFGADLWEIPRE